MKTSTTAASVQIDMLANEPQGQEVKTDTCQPPTNTPSSPSLAKLVSQPLLDVKDRRAYEVARQRAKHPEDRRKARNKKAKHGWFTSVRRTCAREGAVEEVSEVDSVDAMRAGAVRESRSKPEAIGIKGSSANANEREITVHLEDLIRVGKVRKGKAGDFELIPQVRAVIALDDTAFDSNDSVIKAGDFEVDDWEHIESCSSTSSSDEDEPIQAPSYAQVVSSTKQ